MIRRIGEVRIIAWPFMSGLSLGWFCFVPHTAGERMIRHEYGHTRQSLLLGPVYLVIIGIPSFLWAVLIQTGILRGKDPLSFYTERWAERLGSELL